MSGAHLIQLVISTRAKRGWRTVRIIGRNKKGAPVMRGVMQVTEEEARGLQAICQQNAALCKVVDLGDDEVLPSEWGETWERRRDTYDPMEDEGFGTANA